MPIQKFAGVLSYQLLAFLLNTVSGAMASANSAPQKTWEELFFVLQYRV